MPVSANPFSFLCNIIMGSTLHGANGASLIPTEYPTTIDGPSTELNVDYYDR